MYACIIYFFALAADFCREEISIESNEGSFRREKNTIITEHNMKTTGVVGFTVCACVREQLI